MNFVFCSGAFTEQDEGTKRNCDSWRKRGRSRAKAKGGLVKLAEESGNKILEVRRIRLDGVMPATATGRLAADSVV